MRGGYTSVSGNVFQPAESVARIARRLAIDYLNNIQSCILLVREG